MKIINNIEVYYEGIKVGTLAQLRGDYRVAFEYDSQWLINGFSISPFSLPLEKKVFIPKSDTFDGLFGVFTDSLPDGWGRLLVDRFLITKGIEPHSANPVTRLAMIKQNGMGALEYKPTYSRNENVDDVDLDLIALECQKILESKKCDNLDSIFKLAGSSGGARPKVLIDFEDKNWIIKFPSSMDSKNIGEEEYLYSLCAKKCGLEMMETKLFPSKECSGYFGVERFDRYSGKKGNHRIHMVSASALLETSHRIPSLDYNTLMKLTLKLTGSYLEVEKMFRLMCFNVYAHNRDDHSKNFSFLYEDNEKKWKLSPVYDLTYSYSLNGEHATSVNGNGENPGLKDILEVAEKIGMDILKAKDIALQIEEIINHDLKEIMSKHQ